MTTFIMLSTLTDEGRKTLKQRPARLKAVNKEVESMGARVMSQYAVLGGYDFVNVIEAPSNEVMARIAMELGARGTMKVTTMPAMGIDQFVEMMTKTAKTMKADSENTAADSNEGIDASSKDSQ